MKKHDVKESLTKKVELEASKEEELVAVEMTPEQRDRIVRILADEKLQKEADESRGAYEMDLVFAHHINGIKFGPGRRIRVPEGLQGKLQAAESLMRNHEINLMASHSKQFEIFQSGQAVPVRVK